MYKKYKKRLLMEYKTGSKSLSLVKSGYMGESKPNYRPLRLAK